MPERTLTLNIKSVNVSALTGLKEVATEVNGTVKSSLGAVDKLVAGLERLNGIKLTGLQGQFRETEGVVKSFIGTAQAAIKELFDLDGVAGNTARSLGRVGTASEKADGGLKSVGGSAVTTAGALDDVGVGAKSAEAGLIAADTAADATGRALSSVSRRATTTAAKLDALNAVKIDPAPVVAAANAMTVALRGTSAAAIAARGGINGPWRGPGGAGRAPVVGALGMAGSIFRGAQNVAMGVTGLGLYSALSDAKFSNELQGVYGNTKMSAADRQRARSGVLRLMGTGSKDQDLMNAYMHASNFQYTGAGLDNIVRQSNMLAIGTHAPVGDTGQAEAGVMNAYGHVDPKMARRVGNILHAGTVNSDMMLAMMEKNTTRTFGYAANYKVGGGITGLADVMAAYGALVQHRMTPSRADTQISGMLQQIAAPSPKAEKEAARLGLSGIFNTTGLQREGLFGVTSAVREKVNALPVNERAAALKALFNNKQGGTGAQFLTGQSFQSYRDIYKSKGGTLDAANGGVDYTGTLYNQQMAQPAQRWAALQSRAQADFIPIGEKMLPIFEKMIPVLERFAGIIAKVMDGFTRLPQPIQEGILAFGALSAVSKVLGMGHLGGRLALGEKGGMVARLFAAGSGRLGAVRGVAGAAEGEVGALTRVVTRAASVAPQFGQELPADAAGARAGQFSAVSRRLPTGGFAPAFGKGLVGSPLVGETAAAGEAGAAEAGAVGVSKLMGPIGLVITAVVALAAAWKTNFGGIRQVGMGVVGNLTGFFKSRLPEMQETVKTVTGAIEGFFKAHGGRLKAIASAAWKTVGTVITTVLNLVEGVVSVAMDAINGHWTKAGTDLKGIVTNLWGGLKGILVNGLKLVGNVLMGVVDVVKGAVERGAQLWLATFKSNWQKFHVFVVEGLHNAFEAAKAVVAAGMGVVARLIDIGTELIHGNFSGAWQRIVGLVGPVWVRIRGAVQTGVENVGKTIGSLAQTLVNLGNTLWDKAVTVGVQLVAGIVAGVTQKWGEAKSAITGMADGMIKDVKYIFDIHSPSGVFRNIGSMLALGLAAGITASSGAPISAMDTLQRQITAIHDRYTMARAGTRSRTAQAGLDIRERHEIDAARRQYRDSGSQFSGQFGAWGSELTHENAKYGAKLTDNASFKSYLDDRIKALDAFKKANAGWLAAHASQARAFEAIESRFDSALQRVDGKIQAAARSTAAAALAGKWEAVAGSLNQDQSGPDYAAMLAKFHADQAAGRLSGMSAFDQSRSAGAINAAALRQSRERDDKKQSWMFEQGNASAPDTLNYFQGRQKDLEAAGKAYTDEWYEIAGRVKELTRQIAEAERSLAEVKADDIRNKMAAYKAEFEKGGEDALVYAASLKTLREELSLYETLHPGSNATLDPLIRDLVVASAEAQRKGLKPAKPTRDRSAGTAIITDLIDQAKSASTTFLEALFKGGKAKKNAGKILLDSILDSINEAASKAITDKIFGAIFGSKFGLGGSGSGSGSGSGPGGDKTPRLPDGTAIPGGNPAASAGKGAEIGAAMGAVAALTAIFAKGASKKQKRSGIGALLGGGIGWWLGGPNGAMEGEAAGGLLGGLFAQGGVVPGTGSRDTFPAMLTPGEMVLPRGLSMKIQALTLPAPDIGRSFREGGWGAPTVHANQNNTYHGDMLMPGDVERHQAEKDRQFQVGLRNVLASPAAIG